MNAKCHEQMHYRKSLPFKAKLVKHMFATTVPKKVCAVREESWRRGSRGGGVMAWSGTEWWSHRGGGVVEVESWLAWSGVVELWHGVIAWSHRMESSHGVITWSHGMGEVRWSE